MTRVFVVLAVTDSAEIGKDEHLIGLAGKRPMEKLPLQVRENQIGKEEYESRVPLRFVRGTNG